MTELFNGGEMDAFYPSDSSVVDTDYNINGPRYNSSFCRGAIAIGFPGGGGGDTTYAETAHWSPQTEGYLHWEVHLPGPPGATNTLVSLLNNSGTTIYRIRCSNPGGFVFTLTLQYLNASLAWIDVGAISLPFSLHTCDLHWKNDASGALNFYIAGTERLTLAADTSHLAGVAYARFHNVQGIPFISQVFADTDPTIGHRLKTVPPTGAGATSSWTGTADEINEITYNDATFINSAAANQVSTFAVGSPSLSGYVVRSITVSSRANRDPTGPQKLRHALRVSGTDYYSGSDISLSVGEVPYQTIWETNPASSGEWSNTAAAAVQPGVKSIT